MIEYCIQVINDFLDGKYDSKMNDFTCKFVDYIHNNLDAIATENEEISDILYDYRDDIDLYDSDGDGEPLLIPEAEFIAISKQVLKELDAIRKK